MSGMVGNESDWNNKLSLVRLTLDVGGHQACYATGNFRYEFVRAF